MGNKKFSWSATEEKSWASLEAQENLQEVLFFPLCGIEWWLGNLFLCMAILFFSLKII